MTEVEATLAVQALGFLEALGLSFGDIIILLVIAGAFWLINKGKLKVGGNGYVTETEFRAGHKALHARLDRQFAIIEEAREDIQELGKKVAKLEVQIEQYKN